MCLAWRLVARWILDCGLMRAGNPRWIGTYAVNVALEGYMSLIILYLLLFIKPFDTWS